MNRFIRGKVGRQLHCAVGLVAAAFIIAIAGSGGLLLFKKEMEPVSPRDNEKRGGAGNQIRLRELVTKVEEQYFGKKVRYIFPAEARGELLRMELVPGQWEVFVDPETTEIVAARDSKRTFSGWIRVLHTTLFLEHSGKWLNSGVATALVVLVISGLLTLAPKALRLKNARRAFRESRVFHTFAGVLLFPAILLSAITGIYLHFPTGFQNLFRAPVTVSTSIGADTSNVSDGDVRLELEDICQIAVQHGGAGVVTRIALPPDLGAPIVVRLRGEDERHPNGMFFISVSERGEVVQVRKPASGMLNRALYWAYPLHVGAFGGIAGTAMLAIAAIGLVALSLTGVVSYYGRMLRKRSAVKKTA